MLPPSELSSLVLLLWMAVSPALSAVQDLGNPAYSTREAGTNSLIDYVQSGGGWLALPMLRLVERYSDDLEVRVRAKTVLAGFPRTDRVEYAFIPWIDMLPEAMPDRYDLIDRYVSLARGWVADGPGWPEYRVATGLWMRDQMKAGMSRDEVRAKVLEMMAREIDWHRRNEAEEVGRSRRQ